MTFRSRDFPNAKKIIRAKFGKPKTPKAKKPKYVWPDVPEIADPIGIHMPEIVLVNTLNAWEPWRTRHSREQREKDDMRRTLSAMSYRGKLPCVVGMIREYSGRAKPLDTDGLHAGFKSRRDVIAEWLRTDDGENGGVLWLVEQRRGEFDGIEIVVVPVIELPKRQAVGDYLPKG